MSARFEPAERNHGIDLFRGVAVLLVVLLHMSIRIPIRHTQLGAWVPKRLDWALFRSGYDAVFMFFVISGFLIAGNVLDRHGSLARLDWPAFARRRVARILPYLLVLLGLLSLLARFGPAPFRLDEPRTSIAGAVFATMTLRMNAYLAWVGPLPPNWDVLWSLSIEELFYLGFPLLCLVCRVAPKVTIGALACFALSLPALHPPGVHQDGNEVWAEKATLQGMAAIAVGVTAALCVRRLRGVAGASGAAVLYALGSIAILADLAFSDVTVAVIGVGGTLLLLSLGSAALLSAMWLRPPGGALIRRTRWLQAMGRRSYEIYLTHMFIVLCAVAVWRVTGTGLATGWVWFLPAVAGSALLGEAVARWFSDPADRVVRGWLTRRNRAARLSTTADAPS